MSDYDYLNARVRGMSTALLGRDFYEGVLDGFAETTLRDALMASPYQDRLQEALAADPEPALPAAVEDTLREAVRRTYAKVLALAPPRPRRLLTMQVNRWDLADVIAVIRAMLAGAEQHRIVDAVLAVGELDADRLAELAGAPDVVGVAEWLTAGEQPFAFVLRRAILDCEAPRDPRALERAACAAFYRWALAGLDESDPAQAVTGQCLRWQVDLLNVLGILSIVRAREHGGGLAGEAGGGGEAGDTFEPVARGTIPGAFLRELSACESLEAAFEALTDTWFSPGIEKGILAYGQARSLAAMERFLESVMVERACRLFRLDMLGIGVALGYIWRRYAEMCNVRLLTRGIVYRMTANAVREGLVIV